jgi:hypothetical protein
VFLLTCAALLVVSVALYSLSLSISRSCKGRLLAAITLQQDGEVYTEDIHVVRTDHREE